MKKRKNKVKKFIIIIISIILISVFGYYLYYTYKNIDINTNNYETSKVQFTNTVQTVENIEKNNKNIADIIEETTESVVGISKLKNSNTSIFSKSSEDELGLGTGVIVSSDGYILSNAHVTGQKYSKCYITLENGNIYDGTVMWSDSDLDLSITKINEKDLKYASLGDSSSVRTGETVYAIGNPIGFEFRRTVTSGIISATNRTIKIEEDGNSSYMSDLIQTDATINPGNSGGPLILPNGEVIGINTVKITSAEGIGFAIPINLVKGVIDSFVQNGSFEEATIGIYAYDREVIPYLNSWYTNFEKGIYVAQITINGPASTIDLKEGDIINSIDGVTLNTMNDLRTYIYTKKPGDEVILSITRNKINKNVSIILGKK